MREYITEPLAFPEHLDIESTNNCFLSCPMCPHHKMTREKGFLQWDTLITVLRQSEGKVKDCYFHQVGEPLLHPEIIPMVRAIKNAGLWVSLSTNGVLLTEELFLMLSGAGLDHITLSLESTNEGSYSGIRVGASYSVVRNNIDRAIKIRRSMVNGPHIELQLIPMVGNAEVAEDFRKMYDSILNGIGNVYFKEYCVWAGEIPDLRVEKKPSTHRTCTMINYSLTVQWNGDVVLCCLDYDGTTRIGNVREKTLEELWNGPEIIKARFAIKNRDLGSMPNLCKNCTIYERR